MQINKEAKRKILLHCIDAKEKQHRAKSFFINVNCIEEVEPQRSFRSPPNQSFDCD